MTKKKGIKTALFGLVLGLALGLGFVFLQNYVASELIGLLRDELQIACPDCDLKTGKRSFSFFSFDAVASNATIFEKGEKRVFFEKIEADFNPKLLWSETILLLEKLRLLDGEIWGADPKSAAYRFVRYLAEPPDPSKDVKGKLRVKLLSLDMLRTDLWQDYEGLRFLAKGGELRMARPGIGTDFTLKPAIPSIFLLGENQERELLFSARATIEAGDDIVSIHPLELKRAGSFINASIDVNGETGETLAANLRGKIRSGSLPTSTVLKLDMAIEGGVHGTLDDLRAELLVEKSDGSQAAVIVSDEDLSIEKFRAVLKASAKQDEISAELSLRELTGQDFKLTERKALRLQDESLSGALRLRSDKLSVDSFELKEALVDFNLKGTLLSPILVATADIGELRVSEHAIPGVSAEIEIAGPKLQADAELFSDLSQSVELQGEYDFELSEGKADAKFNKIALNKLASTEVFQPGLFAEGVARLEEKNGKIDYEANLDLIDRDQLQIRLALKGDQNSTKIEIDDSTDQLSLSGEIPLGDSSLQSEKLILRAKGFTTRRLIRDPLCTQMSFEGELPLSQLSASRLEVSELDIGCDPYKFELTNPSAFQFTEQGLRIPESKLKNDDGEVSLSGDFYFDETFDFDTVFSSNLEILLPLLPAIDGLGGSLEGNLNFQGSFEEPSISGEASLSEAYLVSEEANLSIEDLNAELLAEGQTLRLNSSSGRVNNGDFDLTGILLPLEPQKSSLRLRVSDLLIEPDSNLNATFDGIVELFQNSLGRPEIRGEVTISSAIYRQEFDLAKIIEFISTQLSEQILRKRKEIEDPSELESGGVDSIKIDLKLKIPGNSFIATNFLNTELRGDLSLNGTLGKPQIEGKIQSLRGWVGFQNRSFQITSGEIQLDPDKKVPEISLSAETYVPSRLGDNTLIFLELSGSVTEPNVQLVSDTGLSESEILELLSSSLGLDRGRFGSKSLTTDLTRLRLNDLLSGDISLFDFLRSVARIDSINIEPAYNIRRGAVEPVLVARKQINPNLSIEGRSFLSTANSEGSAFARYVLSPRLRLSGGIDSEVTQENSSLAIDLAYEAITGELASLDSSFVGDSKLSNRKLRQLAGINQSSILPLDGLSSLRERLLTALLNLGYLDAKVDLRCLESYLDKFCKEVEIFVSEGPEVEVSELVFSGELALLSQFEATVTDQLGEPASRKTRDELAERIVRILRNEGYLAARATVNFERVGSTFAVAKVEVLQGRPMTFNFEGNRSFSARELLDTINLFSRSQPFGPNTPRILVSSIERLYRENGYLLVSVVLQRDSSAGDPRDRFTIKIEEGEIVEVDEVSLKSPSELASVREDIQAKYSDATVTEIFSPRFVIEERLEAATELLEEYFRAAGYSQVNVNYKISLHDDGTKASLEYLIKKGGREVFGEIIVNEEITELVSVDLPKSASKTQLETLRRQIQSDLRSTAYRNAKVELELSGNKAVFNANLGPKLTLGEIEFDGLTLISPERAFEIVEIYQGTPLTEKLLRDIRSRLLRSGLFSRIEIEELIHEDNSSERTLKIGVQERSLYNLTIGAGANSELGVHAFSEALDRSTFLDGRTLAFRLDAYYDPAEQEISQGIASLRYLDPNFVEGKVRFSEEIRFQDVQLPTLDFDLDRVSISSDFLISLPLSSSLSLGHTLLREDLSSVSPDVILSPLDSGNVDLGIFRARLIRDKRNSPFNPSKGSLVSLEASFSDDSLLSDASYSSLLGETSLLFPLRLFDENFVLASRSRAGRFWTFGDTDAVPISQRFFLGGRNTIRGFRENALGPRGVDGGRIGGEILFAQNLELQWRLNEFLSLSSFVDAGSLFLTGDDISGAGFRESVGLGARFLSPIGPVGIDIGRPLDQQAGEPSFRLHFSIGSLF